MNPLIRKNRAILLTLMLAGAMLANAENPSPHFFNKKRLSNSAKGYNSRFTKEEANSAKLCVCQVVSVKSTNEQTDRVLVMAEKTNNGDLSNGYSVAREVLEKEKKQMKRQFYSNVKVTQNITAATDCRSLVKKLQSMNDDLKLYDILNADILGSIHLSVK